MKYIFALALLLSPAIAQTPAAPDWTLKDIAGRTIRLRDYQGKVVLLNFWATWCAPCRAEVPDLVRWQREHAKAGLQIIGITYPPQTKREIRSFVRKYKLNYPIIQGTPALKSHFTASETLPFTIVIDAAGNIHTTIEGILFADEFAAHIQPLLQKPARRR
ncbi:MAG TPA: TlpA disulfide reductase family protein [Blastocatellia bacterium]|nr:TlpA disulfide reductase family protein [Blastocatellia bacterium]